MNINDLKDYKVSFSSWTLLSGYDHIGINTEVCNGDPTIIGTRLRPSDISNYGTIQETADDFDLTMDEVNEAIRFVFSS